jgi:alpha-tubulin suppressor-like RCC1 family protein
MSWGRQCNALGHAENTPLPKPIPALSTIEIVDVFSTMNVTYAVSAEGRLYVWGTNIHVHSGSALLGLGDEQIYEQNTPRMIPGLETVKVTAVRASNEVAFALTGRTRVSIYCRYNPLLFSSL